MTTLTTTALDPAERRTLERFVELLAEEFGAALHAVWLFGSRARGERTHDESDVDLLVILDRPASWDEGVCVVQLVNRAANESGTDGPLFAPHIVDTAWVEDRRAIKSFFMREVDRDKVVLAGEP